MKKIILFDPSLSNNNGASSNNLGDIIIKDSVMNFLKLYFKNHDIINISTHVPISKMEKGLIKNTDLVFVGGTNLLSSDIKVYNQWKSNYYNFFFNLPIVKNAILFGVGWWQYQGKPTTYTRSFYKKLLSNEYNHSVRDAYSMGKVGELGVKNCINTSCPTTWGLGGLVMDRKDVKANNVLLMLTDYHPNTVFDNELINIFLEKFNEKIYFFPQGAGDLAYLKSLESYKQNKQRFILLDHNIDLLDRFVKSNSDIVYIGTRLHGGIKCLQNGISSLILANDNRSKEIGRDINLAVVDRNNFSGILNWVEGKTNYGEIKLPITSINNWKNQFFENKY